MTIEKLAELRLAVKDIQKPASLTDVGKLTGLSRPTVAKWLRVMEAGREIQLRRIGNVLMVLDYVRA